MLNITQLSINIALEAWASLFCVVAIIVILVTLKGAQKKTSWFLILSLFFCGVLLVSDGIRLFVTTLGYSHLKYLLKIATFMVFLMNIMLPLSQIILFHTVASQRTEIKSKFWMRGTFSAGIIAFILLCLNPFYGFFYTFDDSKGMVRGDTYFLAIIIFIFIVFIIFAFLVAHRKYLSARELVGCMAYCILPTISFVLQKIFIGFHAMSLTVAFCLLLEFTLYELDLRDKLMEARAQLNILKISLLRSQMKPHFIFNSLNSIYMLVDMDRERSKQTISEFSSYLRGLLSINNERPLVPFERELELIRHYLYMEKLRFGEDLVVEYKIGVTNFSIPPITLQPLVENAVKHGVMKRPDGGILRISTINKEDRVRIIIEDNGVGFEYDPHYVDKKEHIGLSNVRFLLENICKGKMQVDSVPGEGTTITIEIPKAPHTVDLLPEKKSP